MATVNRRQYVLRAQMNFGEFLDHYLREHVYRPENLASSTQAKYETHIKNHIRPALGSLTMAAVDTRRIDSFLASKSELAWATRMDLRNILCGIFTCAEKWGLWKERNPALHATVGRKRAVREQRKLTLDETRSLLAALPEDVRLMCVTSLLCTLRVSELLGLQWKHVDWDRRVLMIRQRYYRGDIDTVKSDRARREPPIPEFLAGELLARRGHPEEYVFAVKTRWGYSRDDRDILQHFLRPAAVALGIYRPGFGFHSMRREAITNLQSQGLGPLEVMRLAGHAGLDMTAHYTLGDPGRQAEAVNAMERRVMGRVN